MLNREARLAACKICDEYPTVEFPKVPSGTDTQSVLDWCIEAEQCFQKSKRDGFKNISGKKALEILPAHHPFSPRYDVSLGYTFDQTRFLQSRNIHDAIKIVKKLAMYWTSLEVKYPKEAMQLLRCVRSGLSTYRAKNRNIPPIPNDWLGIQDWIIDANKCLHKASKTIETKKNKNEDLTDTEQNSGEAGKTKNKPDTQNIAVDDKELTILIELNAGDNKTFSQVEIGASTSIKRGTIKDKLPRLEKIGLIYRPLGKRKGYQITDKGREIAKRHQ
jgi:predicted transcriptional regulator